MEKNAMYHTPTEKKLVNTLFDIDGIVYVNIMAKRDVRLNIERIEQILSLIPQHYSLTLFISA